MAQELLTWQQKVEKGIPLAWLEQVKKDAHDATMRRINDENELRARQAAQEAGPSLAEYKASQKVEVPVEAPMEAPVAEEAPVVEAVEQPKDSNKKKGN